MAMPGVVPDEISQTVGGVVGGTLQLVVLGPVRIVVTATVRFVYGFVAAPESQVQVTLTPQVTVATVPS
jgi:hypothetical protein